MYFPYVRLQSNDQNNGFTFARSPNKAECQQLPRGTTKSQTFRPGPLNIEYQITAAHRGGCEVFLDVGYTGNFQLIGSDPSCGLVNKDTGIITVTLPDNGGRDYDGALRWFWLADNNNQPGNRDINENYNNCADIKVSASSGDNAKKAPINGGFAPSANGNPPPVSQSTVDASNNDLPAPSEQPVQDIPVIATPAPAPAPAPAEPANPAPAPAPAPAPEQEQQQEERKTKQSNRKSGTASGNNNSNNNIVESECTTGAFECKDIQTFRQCNHNQWIDMPCAPGTVCVPTTVSGTSSIVCGYPAALRK
jgi:hypothetical protein